MRVIRLALKVCLLGVAVLVLLVYSVAIGGEVHRQWPQRRGGLVTSEFIGWWPRLNGLHLHFERPSKQTIIDEEIQSALDRLRGVSLASPIERVQLVVEDGKVTFERLNAQGEVIRTPAVCAVSSVVEEEPSLFVDLKDGPPPPDDQELADESNAVDAAIAFWRQRDRLVSWRHVQQVVNANSTQLQEREPDEMVYRLSKKLDVPEDVVWKNYEQAVWIAKLIATRDDIKEDGPSWMSYRLRGSGEWADIMYPARIEWTRVGMAALVLSIFVCALGYLSIMLTAGPRTQPAASK